MISDPRFVIIAGTARNVGKTTLACQIISSFQNKKVIALKFITLKKDGFKHAHHQQVKTFELIEEQVKAIEEYSEKDTHKMLRSGAQQSFMLVSQEECISEAIKSFLVKAKGADVIVVESATLRKYLEPKAFIIVDRPDAEQKKAYIQELIPLSDYQISNIKDELQVESLFLKLNQSF